MEMKAFNLPSKSTSPSLVLNPIQEFLKPNTRINSNYTTQELGFIGFMKENSIFYPLIEEIDLENEDHEVKNR